MSKREFTTAERIALTIALESMRNLGWHNQPEMLLDKIILLNTTEDGTRQYRILFTLFGERQSMFKVEVTIRTQEGDYWMDGVVMAFHWITTIPRQAKFAIVWERGTPRVVLEPFFP